VTKSRKNGSENKRTWWYIAMLAVTLAGKYKAVLPLLSKIAVPAGTMLLSVLAYAWVTRNWMVGAGIVAMIFIHETGHVLAAKRKGLPVTLPIFIPFLGAFIAMKKHPRDAATEAYIALGGPVFGALGALAAFALGAAFSNVTLLIVAYIGFFLNLINLLPIHPLDGGRIAAAVTRWLWAAGLIGGLWIIWQLKSLLFLIIWVMFAWEMYQKYGRSGGNRSFVLPFRINIPAEYLRMQGAFVPGEEHRRELSFSTWSDMDRNQIVEVVWDSLGVSERVTLQNQYLIKSVRVTGVKHMPGGDEPITSIVAYCEMSGEPFEHDRYFEVPPVTRWAFGIAYFGLAAFLGAMMAAVHGMGIPGVRG